MSDEAIPGGLNEDDLAALTTPTADTPMTDHAEQHSALTRIQRDNVVKFAETEKDITELKNDVNRNTGDIDDISEYLGGIYFEISLGVDKYVFDTQPVPREGNFAASTYNFDIDNTEFRINAYLGDGTPSTLFEKARPGDKLSISYPSDPLDNGQYFITSTRLDGDVWIINTDLIQGSGRITAGFTYNIEIVHVSKQFNDEGVGGPLEPLVAIGDNPPPDEKSRDGDLWWDSVRMEMFIRYQEAWITTNALSARVEAGEQVQAELLARVAVGEEQQTLLHKQVDRIDDDVKYRQRPVPWKYKSSSTEPIDLKPGEFTARTSGSESDGERATIDFYLNEFDACGMRWYPPFGGTEYWHDLTDQFMLSLGLLGDGITLHAKTGRWTWNHGGNGYAKISGKYRKQKKSLMGNFFYIINFPGYLPMFATDQQITRTFSLEDDSPQGEVPFEVEEGNSK